MCLLFRFTYGFTTVKSHINAHNAPRPSLNPGTLQYTCAFTPEKSLSPAVSVVGGLLKSQVETII